MGLLPLEQSAFIAVAEALRPFDDQPTPTGAEIADSIAAYLDAIPFPVAAVVRGFVAAIEVSTIARTGRPFSMLSLAERRTAIERWEKSRLYPRRFAVLSLKITVGLATFRDARVRDRVNFRPLEGDCQPK